MFVAADLKHFSRSIFLNKYLIVFQDLPPALSRVYAFTMERQREINEYSYASVNEFEVIELQEPRF